MARNSDLSSTRRSGSTRSLLSRIAGEDLSPGLGMCGERNDVASFNKATNYLSEHGNKKEAGIRAATVQHRLALCLFLRTSARCPSPGGFIRPASITPGLAQFVFQIGERLL